MLNKFKRINQIVDFINNKNISSFAASAAFFIVLSFFPLLILVCTILPYTNISIDALFYYLSDIIPDYILELAKSLFDEYDDSKIAVISVTALLALWASGKGAYALRNGIAIINNVKSNDKFAIARIRSSLYTLFFIAIVFFFLIVMVFGNKINDFLMINLPNYNIIYSVLIKIRFLFVWIILSFIFQIMYALMPGNGRKFFKLFPGSLFASIMWSIISWGFSLYIDIFGNISIYGNFVGIIFALLWLYWCCYIILIGGVINYFYINYFEEYKKFINKIFAERNELDSKNQDLINSNNQDSSNSNNQDIISPYREPEIKLGKYNFENNKMIDSKMIDNKMIDNKMIDSKMIDSKMIDNNMADKNMKV